jgi:hypothetical protein
VAAKQIEAWEYVAVDLEVGENVLDLIASDSLGNERARRSIKVYTPGKLAQLQFETQGTLVADGRTSHVVRLKLSDAAGVPVMMRTPITLTARDIKWGERDVDPNEEGVQIFVQGGQAELLLSPKVTAGDAYLLATADSAKTEYKVTYVGELRPLIAVGVVEGTLRLSNQAIAGLEPVRETDPFERELTEFARSSSNNKQVAAARAAFFIKGKILGKYLLTASYDSEKQTGERLFSDIKPDAYYPIYGDSSVRGFDAQSSGKLFVRIDKERSYLMLGDFAAAPSSMRQLTNFDRNMYGVKMRVDEAVGKPEDKTRIVAEAYAARGTQRKVTLDEIAGTGLTGPYRLPNINDVLENSEIVEVVVRDRLRPSVILKTTRLTRFADYVIDAVTGDLRLIVPLASIDQGGNPQYLRISFERLAGGEKFWTYGGSAQVEVSDKLTVGVAAVENKDPGKPTLGAGVYAQAKVGKLTVNAEWAHVENKVGNGTDSSAPTAAEGNLKGQAARIEARYQDGALTASASAVKATNDYEGLGSGATAGQLNTKLDISYSLSSGAYATSLTGQALYNKDAILSTSQRGYQVGVKQKLGSYLDAELGLRHYDNRVYKSVLDNLPETRDSGETWIAKLAARAPFDPNLTGSIEFEQDVSKTSRRRLVLGANYKVGIGRFYAKHEMLDSLGNTYSLNDASQSRLSTFGFAVDYALAGSIYGEYRMPGAMDAKPSQAALGIKHKFTLNPNWALSVQAERTQAVGTSPSDLAGGKATAPERNTAFSAAIEYTGDPNLRFMQRIEWRKTQNEKQLNLLLTGAYHLNEDWSALGRIYKELREQESGNAGTVNKYDLTRIQFGAAFRPVKWDDFNALAKVEFNRVKNTGVAFVQTDSTILSFHTNWLIQRGLTLSNRYAAKWARVAGMDGVGTDKNHAQLLYGRITYDLTERVDLGFQAFGMWAKGGTKQYGYGLEIGYLLHSNLWLSLGHNWMGFVNSDLARDLQTTKGTYLRLRMKFDENSW